MPLQEDLYPLTVRDGLQSGPSWPDSRVSWTVGEEKVGWPLRGRAALFGVRVHLPC